VGGVPSGSELAIRADVESCATHRETPRVTLVEVRRSASGPAPVDFPTSMQFNFPTEH